jgi:hypothetical protein
LTPETLQGRRLFELSRAVCIVTLTSGAAGCHAATTSQQSSSAAQFAPAETRTLRSFGANGDGRTDDTAAIARALSLSEHYCLDGEGRTYRINGTLRAADDLCLRNVTLVQAASPVDTARYIGRGCPLVQDPSAVIDCKDPSIPSDQINVLWRSLSLRTLLIRPSGRRPIRVNLEKMKVDRGRYAEQGSRSDSAGIWLDGADRIDLRDVEITGDGKGYGLQITNAHNVTLTNLWVHDLAWAPYPGDSPLSEARVAAIGWNSVPIHEFRERGPGGVPVAKFYGARIQEQLTCASLSNVSHVRITGIRVERCMARFVTGNLPWQADGLDIGGSSSDIIVNGAKIDSTWEGMDVVADGDGINGLQINDLNVSNSFSFGLKMGYQLRNARVTRLNVDGAGLAGVALYGPVHDVQISHASIRGVGTVAGNSGSYSPWPPGNRAGIRLDGARNLTPEDVLFEDVAVSGHPRNFEFGILNTGGRRIQLIAFRAEGFGSERTRGIEER